MAYDSDSGRLTFLKERLVLQNDFVQVLESYTTVCAIEWSSGRYWYLYQIRAVQAECLHIFFSMEVCIGKELKWVCNFHIHWMHNWIWYHLIELTKSFLLKYGYWTFIKGGLRTRLEGIPNLIIYATGYPYPYYTCKVPILNVTDKCIRYKLLIYICVVYHHRHFSDVYFPLK